MIRFLEGNILEADTEAIVNTVNCEGYMGKGIAYQFKIKYPKNNEAYIEACKNGILQIGKVLPYKDADKIILNFPTKDRWREKSQYDYIEKGVEDLGNLIQRLNLNSVSIPALGCGNGGLDWLRVKEILISNLMHLNSKCEINIFEPTDNLAFIRNSTVNRAPKLNTSHLLLILIKMNADKFNKLRLQKTAYLINYFSAQDFFKFDAHNFGPYAHSIDILSRDIKEFQLYYGLSTSDAYNKLIQTLISDKIENKLKNFAGPLHRAVELVNSIAEDKQLELLTTILFLVEKSHRELTLEDLVSNIHSWSDHKKNSFSREAIVEMTQKLLKLGLLKKNLYHKLEPVH